MPLRGGCSHVRPGAGVVAADPVGGRKLPRPFTPTLPDRVSPYPQSRQNTSGYGNRPSPIGAKHPRARPHGKECAGHLPLETMRRQITPLEKDKLIVQLRQRRWPLKIAKQVGMSTSGVNRALDRIAAGRDTPFSSSV